MTILPDPIPDTSQRWAYWLGRLFHPVSICILTLALILRDLPLPEAIFWTTVVAAVVTLPGLLVIAWLQRQQRYVYQRQHRLPVYVVGWFSVLTCLGILLLGDGPPALGVCLAALLVWLPLQMAINTWYTKISTHMAVVAGCATGLWLLGKLDHPMLQLAALAIVVLTGWARITTRDHTRLQVLLGLLVGAGVVLLVFPLF